MNVKIFLLLVSIVFAIVTGFLAVLLSGSKEVNVVISPIKIDTVIATSSPFAAAIATSTVATSTSKKNVPASTPVPKETPKPKTVPTVITPVVVNPQVSTSTENNTIGTTTLAIQSIPLLSGGIVHAGDSVPISYLQVTNIGNEGALLKGFWVKQNGTAPTESIIGLSTVDDQGGSRGLTGGTEGSTPFQNDSAFAPTDAFFAPGQMRLFTIKAIMTYSISPYIGTQLMIEVSLIETTATTKGQFPIIGTTWTIEL